MKEMSIYHRVKDVRIESRTSKNGKPYFVQVVEYDTGYKSDSLIRFGSEFAYNQLCEE